MAVLSSSLPDCVGLVIWRLMPMDEQESRRSTHGLPVDLRLVFVGGAMVCQVCV